MSKHTPGPWSADGANILYAAPHEDDAFEVIEINAPYNSQDRQLIAYIPAGFGQSQTNAAFIVRACNAHEELVNQLRLAQRMLLQTNWRLEEEFMAEIAAAIANAEERVKV